MFHTPRYRARELNTQKIPLCIDKMGIAVVNIIFLTFANNRHSGYPLEINELSKTRTSKL